MQERFSEFEPGDRFAIGGAGREHVEIRVLGRRPEPDYWDGNWLSCEVRVAAGGFRGRLSAYLHVPELAEFAEQVRVLYDQLAGRARLHTMEEQVTLELVGDGRGHIECLGQLRDVAGTGNLLVFRLQLDQTQLFGAWVQLAELLNRHPVRGDPAD